MLSYFYSKHMDFSKLPDGSKYVVFNFGFLNSKFHFVTNYMRNIKLYLQLIYLLVDSFV
jgi:hypothetical protein